MDDNQTYTHGYKLRIYPTEEQKELINKYIGAYRYIYNWGLTKEQEHYKEKKNGLSDKGFYSFYDRCKLFKMHRDNPENAWLKEIPNTTARLALKDVVDAYQGFFDKVTGIPKLKTKKRSPKTFKTRNDRFYIDGDRVRFEGLPRYTRGPGALVDTVKLGFKTDFARLNGIEYMGPSISIDNLGNYWVNFSIKEPIQELDKPKTEPIGVDLGIRKTMTLSTGETFNLPKEKISRLEDRIAKAKRHYSRDIKRRMEEAKRTKTKYDDIPVSKRSQKRLNKIRKLNKKITNIKSNFYHETIKNIVLRNPEAIGIETIQVRKMQSTASKQLRHDLSVTNFYTMRRIFEHKCTKYGVTLIKADSQYPSTQLCSNCGHKRKLKNGKHVYRCPQCGLEMDRDLNAALNLRNLAINS